MSAKTLLTALVLCSLTLPFAATADTTGPAPNNGTRFQCGNGSWQYITFHVAGQGTLRRGTCDLVFPNGQRDTRKCDIAWHNNSPNWEFTLVRQAQCKNMYMHGRYLIFKSCQDVQDTVCWPR